MYTPVKTILKIIFIGLATLCFVLYVGTSDARKLARMERKYKALEKECAAKDSVNRLNQKQFNDYNNSPYKEWAEWYNEKE